MGKSPCFNNYRGFQRVDFPTTSVPEKPTTPWFRTEAESISGGQRAQPAWLKLVEIDDCLLSIDKYLSSIELVTIELVKYYIILVKLVEIDDKYS